MTLATKNGSLIVKDGKLAENCGCCGGKCLIVQTSGFSGFVQAMNANCSAFSSRNSDCLFNGTFVIPADFSASSGFSFFSSPSAFGESKSVPSGIFSVGAISAVLSISGEFVTVTFSFGSSTQRLVMSDSAASDLLAGRVVKISTVTQDTLPTTQDEFGKKFLNTYGSVYAQRTNVLCQSCLCASQSWPDTYTLRFSNTKSYPEGPRRLNVVESLAGRLVESQKWPKSCLTRPIYTLPSYLSEYNKLATVDTSYSGFMTPSQDFQLVTSPLSSNLVSYAVPNPDLIEYIERFNNPIVLRKVAGTVSTYMSDFIHNSPCYDQTFVFDPCSPTGATLSIDGYSTQDTRAFAPAHSCNPGIAEQPDPGVSQGIYSFGDFITVTPGGQYADEPAVSCEYQPFTFYRYGLSWTSDGPTVNTTVLSTRSFPPAPRLAYARIQGPALEYGCRAKLCPPSEIVVQIESADPWMSAYAKTYSAQLLSYERCTHRSQVAQIFGGRLEWSFDAPLMIAASGTSSVPVFVGSSQTVSWDWWISRSFSVLVRHGLSITGVIADLNQMEISLYAYETMYARPTDPARWINGPIYRADIPILEASATQCIGEDVQKFCDPGKVISAGVNCAIRAIRPQFATRASLNQFLNASGTEYDSYNVPVSVRVTL